MNRNMYQQLREIKDSVYTQDHYTLKTIYSNNQQSDLSEKRDLSDLFIKSLYYACQYDRKTTIIFLLQAYFDIFSEIEKIALRQSFTYGKYKIKDNELRKWYMLCIMPLVQD